VLCWPSPTAAAGVAPWWSPGEGAVVENLLKGFLAAFVIGAAIRLVFARGDVAMEQVGAVLMFLGGVGTLVVALLDRRDRRRRERRN